MLKQVEGIILVIFSVIIAAITVVNIWGNPNFWDVTIFNVLTLLVALGVSYLLVQMKTRTRKLKDSLEKIVAKIEAEFIKISQSPISANTDMNHFLMQNRRINNKIKILDSHSEEFDYVKECLRLKTHFSEYEELLGDHFEDKEYLGKSGKEINNKMGLMDDILDELRLKLC